MGGAKRSDELTRTSAPGNTINQRRLASLVAVAFSSLTPFECHEHHLPRDSLRSSQAGLVATNRFWTGIHKKVQRLTDNEDPDNEGGAYEAPQHQLQGPAQPLFQQQEDLQGEEFPFEQQQQQPLPPPPTGPGTAPASEVGETPAARASREPTPLLRDDLTVNSASVPGVGTSTTGVERNFNHVVRVGEIAVQTSRPPSALSMSSNNVQGMYTQTTAKGTGGGQRSGRR